MNFFKNLFGDNDDKSDDKPQHKSDPAPPPSPKRKPRPQNNSALRIQQMREMSQANAMSSKSLEELVAMLVDSQVTVDWRDARAAGNDAGARASERAWSALSELQKRDDSPAILDALLAHINNKPNNLQYQRALGSLDEAIAVPPLLEYAQTGQPNQRLNALKALSEMKAGSAAEGLVNLITDDDQTIRNEAVRALGFTGHPIAFRALDQYDKQRYPVNSGILRNALRWCNVPQTLEEFRKRKAKGDLGIDQTLERLEAQYAQYWQDEA